MNSKTGFPPFSSVPSVDKFNQEVESNFKNKSLLFLASIIPRESDGTIDWKGLDFLTYLTTVLKPQMEQIKFKPSFATQDNYQELARRIKEEINPLLSSLSSQFSSLSNVSDLNNLTETLLSKFFQGNIYADAIHDELGKQLKITNHQKFEGKKTGNQSLNSQWNIALNEFAFGQSGSPEPDPSLPKPNPQPQPSNNPIVRQKRKHAEKIKQILESCDSIVQSLEEIKQNKEALKSQLEERHKKELDPDGKENLISIKTAKEISQLDLEIITIRTDSRSNHLKDLKIIADNCIKDADEFENKSEYEKECFLNGWSLLPEYEAKSLKAKAKLEDFYQNKGWEK